MKKIMAVIVIFLILFSQCSYIFAQEQITLSTYYPAPYGEYQTLAVGPNYTAPDPSSPTSEKLVVEGNVYIGTDNSAGTITSSDIGLVVEGGAISHDDANTFYATGNGAMTHVNLGITSTTGTNGTNYSYCTVGGGQSNIAARGYSTISGGRQNTAIGGGYTTVSGGHENTAGAQYATVGGGHLNTVSEQYATVGGGHLNAASEQYATVGGGLNNTASGIPGAQGWATVSGGWNNDATGAMATVSGGNGNTADGNYATISGGTQNISSNQMTTVSGGQDNVASGDHATVSGGNNNTASANRATVSGGASNVASRQYCTVGGGSNNQAIWDNCVVGGGNSNTAGASLGGSYATVAGGRSNTASGSYSTVAGGYRNTASNSRAAILGGEYNIAGGSYSYAAGRYARATANGAFALSDSTGTSANPFTVNAANVLGTRFAGGYWLLGGNVNMGPATDLLTDPRLIITKDNLGDADRASQLIIRGQTNPADKLIMGVHTEFSPPHAQISCVEEGVSYRYIVLGSTTVGGGYGAVGISRIPGSGYRLDVNGAVRGSSWTNSDIRYKKNITPLNNSLEKILQLQGVEFEWRKEDFPDISFKDGKEIGLIGQEVKDIVPELVHVDEKGYIDMCYAKITPLLIEAVKELKAENEKLEERIASLEKK